LKCQIKERFRKKSKLQYVAANEKGLCFRVGNSDISALDKDMLPNWKSLVQPIFLSPHDAKHMLAVVWAI
jgi:hypothetical protein